MTDHRDPEQELVGGTLLGLGRAASAAPVRPAPRLATLVARARRRRQRRRVGAVLAVTAVLVPAGLGVRAAVEGDQDRSERVIVDPRVTEPEVSTVLAPVQERTVEPEVVPLAASPLSAREAAASVWTGTELLVWGGGAGVDIDADTFDDGAAYDPATDAWRTMARSPLAARARAAAVWTGTEMLVWGGSSFGDGVGGFLDGAAYDPATDAWRPLSPAPSGSDRSFANATVIDGVMVVGGGSNSSEKLRTVLTYDLAEDRWSTIDVGGEVVQVVAAGGRGAVLTWDPPERTRFGVTWLDPGAGTVERGPSLEDDHVIEHLGAVWTGELLVVLGRGTHDWIPGGVVAVADPGASTWRDRQVIPDIGLTWPMAVGFMGEPALLAWTGTDVVAFADGISRYDPATGRAVYAGLSLEDLGEVGCGYDAAHAWTGTEVLWWGGQSCRGEGAALQVATGGRITLPAP